MQPFKALIVPLADDPPPSNPPGIWGPGSGLPTNPIVLPIPPQVGSPPGVWVPVFPTHPIAPGGPPPGIWPGPGQPPGIWPGPGQPPGIWPGPGGPSYPAHPIAPGGPPPGVNWPTFPTPPIVIPPESLPPDGIPNDPSKIVVVYHDGSSWQVKVVDKPSGGVGPPGNLPPVAGPTTPA